MMRSSVAIPALLMVPLLFAACAGHEGKPETPNAAVPSAPDRKSNEQPGEPKSASGASDPKPLNTKGWTNWSRFRGPNGSGIAADTNVPLEWSATKNIVWKTPLPGPGASSAILFGDRVYLTCYDGYGLDEKKPGNPANLRFHLLCINRVDGKILWSKTLASAGNVVPYKNLAIHRHGYASSTPVADESGVYVFFGTTGLIAYSHAGAQRWKVSCGEDTHEFGSASSPILHGDMVLVNAEIESQALLAFDKKTGRALWRLPNSGGKGNTFGTPGVFHLNGRTEIVYASGYNRIAGVDPNKGTKFWEFETGIGRANACPIVHDDLLFVMSGPVPQSMGLRIGGGKATKLWHRPGKGCYVSSPLYHERHLYWVHDGRFACCMEAKSGKEVYKERLEPDSGDIYAAPVLAGGRIYYVSRESGTYVVPATPEYRLLAHNKIETDRSVFQGSPAVGDGKLFLRSDRHLFCIGEKK